MDPWRRLFPLQDDPTGKRSACHTCGQLFSPVDIYPSNTCEQCLAREQAFITLQSPASTKSETRDAAVLGLMLNAVPYDLRAVYPPLGPVSITRSTHRGVTSYQVTDMRTYLSVSVPTRRQANWVADLIEDDFCVARKRTAS